MDFCAEAKRAGRKVVFTNGCFDIVHRGHVEYLKSAAKLGDVLIVGINTDSSVKKIKSRGRPIMNEEDRAAIVAAFKPVDAVCLFEEETPLELIKSLKPDVLVKGSEYAVKDIVGYDQVVKAGGKVVPIQMVQGKSTSDIVRKIKELEE